MGQGGWPVTDPTRQPLSLCSVPPAPMHALSSLSRTPLVHSLQVCSQVSGGCSLQDSLTKEPRSSKFKVLGAYHGHDLAGWWANGGTQRTPSFPCGAWRDPGLSTGDGTIGCPGPQKQDFRIHAETDWQTGILRPGTPRAWLQHCFSGVILPALSLQQ